MAFNLAHALNSQAIIVEPCKSSICAMSSSNQVKLITKGAPCIK